MTGVLLTTEVVAVFLFLLLLAAVLVVVRRRLIGRDSELILSSLRLGDGSPWRTGLLRLRETTLEWYPLFGLFPRRAHEWPRRGVDISDVREVPSPLNPNTHRAIRVSFRVTCTRHGVEDGDLVVPVDAYTGLRAWIESAPPTRGGP